MKFRILYTTMLEKYNNETPGRCAACGQLMVRVNGSNLQNGHPRYRYPGDFGAENVTACKTCGAKMPENFEARSEKSEKRIAESAKHNQQPEEPC